MTRSSASRMHLKHQPIHHETLTVPRSHIHGLQRVDRPSESHDSPRIDDVIVEELTAIMAAEVVTERHEQ